MNSFEKYLKKYLQDYPSLSVFEKVHSIFRAFNFNDRNHLSEHLPWLQLIILKYSFLYGNEQIPKQNGKFSGDRINRLKHKLRKYDDKFDKHSRMRSALDLVVLKQRQIAANQYSFQIDIAEYYREFNRVAEIFLTDWEQKEEVSQYLDGKYGFTLNEYFFVFLSLICILDKNYKIHPVLNYSISYLRNFFNENEVFRNPKSGALREEAIKNFFEIISKSPSQAKECISKDLSNNIPGKEKFYDTSIFEKEIPLIRVQDKTHVPVAPHVLVRASSWFLHNLLRKDLKNKLNVKDGYAFSDAVEKHLLRVAQVANTHNLKILDGSQIEKELNIQNELSPDLMIESENQIFLFESKAITFGTEIKFTLNHQKFIEQFEKRNLIHAVAQLINAYKVLKTKNVKQNKEVFMFVVTLDELYMPNWKTFYKAFLKDIQLNNYSFDKKTINDIKFILEKQEELNPENIFFISVYWYNKFIQVLNSGGESFNSLCDELREIAHTENPSLTWYRLNFANSQKHNPQTISMGREQLPKAFNGLPFESWNQSALDNLVDDWRDKFIN